MMMMTRIGASTPVYKAPVKIAKAPPSSPEEEGEPIPASDLAPRNGGSTSPLNQPPSSSSSKLPPTIIETNTDKTISNGNGIPILEESTSGTASINRNPPTADIKLKRTRIEDRTKGTSQETTGIGLKASTTGPNGSASVDLSDSTTVVDNIPVNTAIGRTDGDTCKLTQKTADGKVKKFEAKKPAGGACIEGELPLTPNNHIEDGDNTVFTQKQAGLPAGVSIEYKQIPKNK